MSSPRDLRIDFYRGLALLIVLVDHIERWSDRLLIESWTLISLGFSDAAEIFVFLSGYVFAIAYSGTLDAQGLWGTLKKATKRALQIYAAYLVAALMLIGIGLLFIDLNPPEYNEHFRIGDRPWESLLAAITLRFHPVGFDILALYVVILPPMAVLLYLLRRRPWLAWALSAGAYVTAQVFSNLNLKRFGDDNPWYFSPLAWQFLFFLGISLASRKESRRWTAARGLWLALSVGVLGLGFFVVKAAPILARWNPSLVEYLRPLYQFCMGWADKTPLAPLRLIHFFALVYLTSQLLPRRLAFWSGRWARPLVVAGQHSLEVFAAGLVISFVAVFVICRAFGSPLAVLTIDAVACACSLAFAFGVRWWKTSPPMQIWPRQADGPQVRSVSAPAKGGKPAVRSPHQKPARAHRRHAAPPKTHRKKGP